MTCTTVVRDVISDRASDSPQSLPQELVDDILDYLSGDRAALLACSIASWTFVQRTRYHLFKHITLDFTTHDAFIKVLSSETCTIRQTREVTMFFSPRLAPVFARLPSFMALNTLNLHLQASVMPYILRAALGDIPGYTLKRLKTLSVHGRGVEDAATLARVMQTVPNLNQFTLTSVGKLSGISQPTIISDGSWPVSL